MSKRKAKNLLIFIGVSLVILTVAIVILFTRDRAGERNQDGSPVAETDNGSGETADGASAGGDTGDNGSGENADGNGASDDGTGDGTDPQEAATPGPYEITSYDPHPTRETKPSRMMSYTNIQVDGKTLSSNRDYAPTDTITFDTPDKYTELEGVITFRGNNFRDAPAYGEADMSRYRMKKLWSVHTSAVTIAGQYWSGNGWTGQPLLVKWPAATKQHMNMEDWAKTDDDLVEAIHASLDGNIYFTDIRSGKPTRETMRTGFVFKGAGALDPRGYPLLYVGSGYNSSAGTSRAFIIDLIHCKVLYEYGCVDPFSLRGTLSFFDSSTLVDAETDTLIQPGENGILYLVKLNTRYNEARGRISVKPKLTKWRYQGKRNGGGSYW